VLGGGFIKSATARRAGGIGEAIRPQPLVEAMRG
jgi:hypothetical protein